MSGSGRVAVLGVMMAAMGCAPKPPTDSARPDVGMAAERELVGSVMVTGSAPMNQMIVLRDDAGVTWRVDGALAPEVRALAGTRVALRGVVSGRGIDVRGYDLRAVDGAPAYLGTVEAAPRGGMRLRLTDGRLLALRSAPAGVRVGQIVWVQGPASVQVQTFGVVRP